MEWIELGKLIEFQKKSKIKAGDGKTEGKYLMYTSSMLVDKYLDEYQYSEEALIMGTGGNASIHYSSGKFGTSTDCYVIYNKGAKALLKYIYYYLLGNIYILEEGFRGAGLKHTNQKYIKNIKIPILSVEAQEKIVKVLDQAQALIDKRKEQIEALDQLIESIFYTMFGDPVRNEKGWELKKLGELGTLGRGISKHRPRDDKILYGNEYPFIQTGDVARSGLYLTNYSNMYSKMGLEQSKLWEKGTLCITIAANIAKTSILGIDACFPDSIVGFIANENSNVIYVKTWFEFLQKIIEQKAPQSAQKNINLKILNELEIITPSNSLQNEFAQKVEVIEKQKEVLGESLELMEENYKSIMDKAFKGQLFN